MDNALAEMVARLEATAKKAAEIEEKHSAPKLDTVWHASARNFRMYR